LIHAFVVARIGCGFVRLLCRAAISIYYDFGVSDLTLTC